MLKIMMFAAVAFTASSAFADEVVIHHDDGPAAVESHTQVEKLISSDGCESKTVHKENDQGDSKTIHKTNCD